MFIKICVFFSKVTFAADDRENTFEIFFIKLLVFGFAYNVIKHLIRVMSFQSLHSWDIFAAARALFFRDAKVIEYLLGVKSIK